MKVTPTPWIYNGSVVTPDTIPEGATGFIYVINFLSSPIATGIPGVYRVKYCGKKTLTSKRSKPAPKAQQLKLDGTPRKHKVKIRTVTSSDWETYMGSNKTLKELATQYPPECFTRVILQWAYSSRELSYLEDKYLHQYNVLEDPAYLNDNIAGRHFRGRLFPLTKQPCEHQNLNQ